VFAARCAAAGTTARTIARCPAPPGSHFFTKLPLVRRRRQLTILPRMLSTSPAAADPSKVAHTVLAETVAAPNGGHLPHTVVQSVSVSVREGPPPVSSHRTTVLPRIELNGAQAELVFDGKQRFEKIRLLGEGGLGEVVGAHDHDIGRKVAIKRLRAEVRSPAALARFVDEIRTIGKLEHPNIIPIHDVGMDESGELYFVMKYVDGETLEDVIQKLAAGDREYHERYTFERRVEIFRALLEALAFAHDRGIIHRDIKPANVMIGKFGEVLLMDWGIAKSLRSDAPELPMVAVDSPASAAGLHGRPEVRGSLPRLRDPARLPPRDPAVHGPRAGRGRGDG
jgi:tRNA A-37 threonylcarbamoyl transferase component Bud32